MQTIRAFVAIPLPDELLMGLTSLQRALDRRVPPGSVRWVKTEGIHLTLKFLGDTPLDRVPAIRAALSLVARNAPGFAYTASGVGCFPNPRRPRVVWVGLDEPLGRLVGLQRAVEEALDHAGFPPEGRSFRPHLTLGRIKRGATHGDAAQVGEVVTSAAPGDLGQVEAASFALIRSVLKPTGAEYTTLAEFPLRRR